MSSLTDALKNSFKGDLTTDDATLTQMSRDTSVFVLRPELVAYPKDTEDVSALVREVAKEKAAGNAISVTARFAGTDMVGGPASRSDIEFVSHCC